MLHICIPQTNLSSLTPSENSDSAGTYIKVMGGYKTSASGEESSFLANPLTFLNQAQVTKTLYLNNAIDSQQEP